MKFLILTILTTAALPAVAHAHPGHIAEQGHGHSHWFIYVLLACAVLAFAGLIRSKAQR
jgi:hypothetical protein